jgi:hypothetical protein
LTRCLTRELTPVTQWSGRDWMDAGWDQVPLTPSPASPASAARRTLPARAQRGARGEISGTGLEIDGIGPNNPRIEIRSGHLFLWDGTRALMGPRIGTHSVR